MSILNVQNEIENQLVPEGQSQTKISPEKIFGTYDFVPYFPSDDEKKIRSMILKQFALSDIIMNKPRPEFNDLSVIGRQQYDQMLWNNYMPNNGDGQEGDELNSWKSRAERPIIRNKIISIAAHATARLIFPKVFAENGAGEEEKDSALVMSDLMEYANNQSDYEMYSLKRVIRALWEPASIGYNDYVEAYRTVKTEKDESGKWKIKRILDEEQSGFVKCTVPVHELYIENPYEADIQKQGYLIWRKTLSYSLAEAKYAAIYPNFKFVRPGMQIIYNDANQSFYSVYDSQMRQDMVEEVIYWNRTLDLKVIMVNGVMLTDYDNPNPRIDKKYPFDKFGYEFINDKFFYYKSLASKMMQDAKIINDLYKMVIDGTYLNIMPPMVNTGGEIITSDVIVPGVVTTFAAPDANLRPITTANNLKAGNDAMFKIEESINESSQEPVQSGQNTPGNQTAYEISRLEANANVVGGLFMKMISSFVKQCGELTISDINQYMTIADLDKLEDNAELVYKSFVMHDKHGSEGTKTRRIKFDGNMPMELTGEEELKESYKLLKNGGKDVEIYKVNPILFRKHKYTLVITPDALSPKSEAVEAKYNLEAYDRMIANPLANQEEAFRLMLSAYDSTKHNPDKFINNMAQPMPMAQPAQAPQPALAGISNMSPGAGAMIK